MIVDTRTFMELAVHLKLASEGILKIACHLTAISSTYARPEDDAEWEGTVEALFETNNEIAMIEKLFRAIMHANKAEEKDAPPESGVN